MNVAENLKQVQATIKDACERSGRNTEDVTVIAVTKYVSTDRAQEAVDNGIFHLAENRKEGLLEKQEFIHDDRVTWHLIGTLQTRKVKDVMGKIDYFHALDRLKLANELNKRIKEGTLNCFVEINISGEESKHGITEDQLDSFIDALASYEHLRVVGLMTMAPNTGDRDVIRHVFHRLRILRDRIQDRKIHYAPCTELSMGMSHDYEIAVEEGATFVRIGTSLVGNE
ncbi:YggS family pyridoxal phosphate-dependent enzyme [Sporolactobacillus shoreicorticis]|uniref:Pyridoxal phosphate homeostasis protein n=1 Tax=Sporolactobacillus shoreicorticis TaxID=1923877 RepID=A0ABW5S8J5_9BACL|nr:YggS family pyridoxal phosphate-dependent enzyme [Sporolactobacillus shoreicorticis]MCO7128106.1 YggS family pyridoxal phosphate-dependent enzyme [Sporolactobacillus shoreicorticis]